MRHLSLILLFLFVLVASETVRGAYLEVGTNGGTDTIRIKPPAGNPRAFDLKVGSGFWHGGVQIMGIANALSQTIPGDTAHTFTLPFTKTSGISVYQ